MKIIYGASEVGSLIVQLFQWFAMLSIPSIPSNSTQP